MISRKMLRVAMALMSVASLLVIHMTLSSSKVTVIRSFIEKPQVINTVTYPISNNDNAQGPNSSLISNALKSGSTPSWLERGNAEDWVMRERAQYVLKQCQNPKIKKIISAMSRSYSTFMVFKPIPLCVAPKGGSTSWKATMNELSHQIKGTKKELRVVVTRHPLTRVISAYKDKFLNGYPLKAYNETFKQITASGQLWSERWLHYWLPALISNGRVTPPRIFFQVLYETTSAFKFLQEHVDENGHLHLNKSLRSTSGYTKDILDTAIRMLYEDLRFGIIAATKAGFPADQQAKLQKRFMNSSFSFVEFLEHIVWTWQLNVMDHHWAPTSQLCGPCRAKFKYVLHIENPQESSFLLRLLKSPLKDVPRKHISIDSVPNQSDLHYYTQVPKELMAKIINMYWVDFEIFGYDKVPI